MNATKQANADALVAELVADIEQPLAGRVEPEDLSQVARLAIYEAQLEAPHLDPVHDRAYLEWRIRQALADQLSGLAGPEASAPVSVISLVELGRRDRIWNGDVGDEVVDRAMAADDVNKMLRTLSADTAEVVRLVFGLGGELPKDPSEVADLLGIDPDVVEGHLWVAERLFRHHSDDRRDRRQAPLTEREYQAFRAAGDLAWYDLRDLNLNNADLSRCDLSQAVLSGLNLWGIKMIEAQASGINLWGSQLDGADLRGADLRLGYLERAGLCGADLSRAHLGGANLWHADLSSARADHADLSGADLRATNLSAADLTGADLSKADLRGADLGRVRLGGANLSGADLEGADLRGADLRWADLSEANLCWLDLSVADLRGASLQGAIRSPKLEALMTRRAPRPERARPLAASA